jgi:predicted dehydrogenase
LVDITLYITGLDVDAVTGATATLVPPVEVDDSCAAAMVFSNAALGSLMAGAHFAGSKTGDECLDIYGDLGQIRVPDPYGSSPLGVYLREKWNELAPGIWHSLPAHQIDVHRAAVDEFAHAVKQGVKPSSNGQSASEVLAVVLAIYQSAAEQRMIRIDEVRRIESEIKQRQT